MGLLLWFAIGTALIAIIMLIIGGVAYHQQSNSKGDNTVTPVVKPGKIQTWTYAVLLTGAALLFVSIILLVLNFIL